MKKKLFIVLMAIVLIIATLLISKGDDMLTLINYKKTVAELTIGEVDLSRVPDGRYEGSFDTILVAANVSVEVKDHKITEILLLEHKNGQGKPAEVIVNSVKEAQSLQVDTISGATASSKIILKAIENALTNAYSK